ncbi:MAG: DcaP family trimeric outer membrane transporter [Comamonas sp.]
MKYFTKAALAVAVSAALIAPSHADELSDLKARLNEMLQQMEALQKKQSELETKQTVSDAKLGTSTPVVAGTLPGSFVMPGTNTSIKIGGIAQLGVIREMNGFTGNTQTVLSPFSSAAGGIPYAGSQASKRSGETSLEARESRLNITTLTPTPYGDLKTLLEGDFYGAGGSKASTNSVSLRLRHAMAELGPWMFGQYWSNSADLMQGPDVFDFGGPVGLAGLNRVPQIRYTWKMSPKSTFSASIEQPTQDFTGADGVAFQAGFNNISTNSLDKFPDLTARYAYADTWGRQSFGLVARRLTATNVGGPGTAGAALGDATLHTNGYSINNQGTFNIFGKDKLYYNLVWGSGAGRYITQQQTSAVLYPNVAGQPNQLKAMRSTGINLSYMHVWNDQWRSTFNYGKVRNHVPHPELPLTALRSVQSVFANLIWTITPQAEVGLEYAWAKIQNDVPASGIGSRLSFFSKYRF